METAIKKAIEGGYEKWKTEFSIKPNYAKDVDLAAILTKISRHDFLYPRLWSDPSFWQCLGKAMGWSTLPFWRYGETCKKCGENLGGIRYVQWQYIWHAFIDHLAEGKSADEFFNEILK